MALYAWTGVRLLDHSINTLGVLTGLFHNELQVIARRIVGQPEKLVLASMIAALLHDAGKAARGYQESVLRGNPYFTCHEMAGGWIAMETVYELLRRVEADRLVVEAFSAATATAVLRHHHGMRSLSACRAAARQGRVESLSQEDLRALADEYRNTSILLDTVSSILQKLADTTKPPNPLEAEARVRKRLVNIERKQPAITAVVSTLTGLLAASDYIAAVLLDGRTQYTTMNPRGYAVHVLRELNINNPQQLRTIKEAGYKWAENTANKILANSVERA